MDRRWSSSLVALVVVTAACEKPERLMRVGADCPVPRADGGKAAQLRFGVWFEAKPGAWQPRTDQPITVAINGRTVGQVRSDCLAPALPPGETRFVALGGADLYAAPGATASIGRLGELTEVSVLAPAGELALIADRDKTLGLVRGARLWAEPRTVDEVALELHWLAEAGKRRHVAEALAELGEANLRHEGLHELACRVAYAGLDDPRWVERLGAGECPARPRLPAKGGGPAVGRCPDSDGGATVTVLEGRSPTATAWACVGPSGSASLFVADHTGRTAALGEVVVTSAGVCPESRALAVWPVGLGACLEVLTEDEACATASGERLERAYCLPPPGPAPAAALEVRLAFRRLERYGLVDEECGELGDPYGAGLLLDDSLCAIERERSGPRATSYVVRDEHGYLLCVRGAHDERGTRDLAFRFDPGATVELRAWPRVCEVDGS